LVSLSQSMISFKKIALSLIFWGVCLFSGSIYLLSMQDEIGVSMKFLGPITPLGGLLMIIGWAIILVNIIQTKK